MKSPNKDKHRNGKTQEEIWKDREKRLEKLLERVGENPKLKRTLTSS